MMQFLLSHPFLFCTQLLLDWKDNLCHAAISEIMDVGLGDLDFLSQPAGKEDNAKHRELYS